MYKKEIDLKKLRKRKNIKLEYLSDKLNMSKSNLSLIENNKRRMSFVDYKRALNVLGYEIIIIDKDNDYDNTYDIELNFEEEYFMIYEKKKNMINYIDCKYEYLKEFLLVFEITDLEGYESFIDSMTYLAKNDKETCKILNDLILLSKKIDIHELHIITNIASKIEEIALEKMCVNLNINKGDLIREGIIFYPKDYTQINGDIVTVVYDFSTFEAGYVVQIDDEEIEIKNMMTISHDKEIQEINKDLLNLFDENNREDIRDMLFKIYESENIYAAYLSVLCEITDNIKGKIENKYINIIKSEYDK